MITIQEASLEHVTHIARLIMEAMNHECCQNFAGDNHTLDDFRRVMERLVAAEESQYSYRNTLVAIDDGEVVGCIVAYNGADLHMLRRAFIAEAKASFGIDYSNMDDETQEGELYLDSLAVDSNNRRKGIATMLLNAATERARRLGIPAVGLLVDKGNPNAERLYTAIGFRYVNDTEWGGHPMRHLQKSI